MKTLLKSGSTVANLLAAFKTPNLNTIASALLGVSNLVNNSAYEKLSNCYMNAVKETNRYIAENHKSLKLKLADIIPNSNDGVPEALHSMINPLIKEDSHLFKVLFEDYDDKKISDSDFEDIRDFFYKCLENNICSEDNSDLHMLITQSHTKENTEIIIEDTNNIIKISQDNSRKLDQIQKEITPNSSQPKKLPPAIANIEKNLEYKWNKASTIIKKFTLKDIYIDTTIDLIEIGDSDLDKSDSDLAQQNVQGASLCLDQLCNNPIIQWYEEKSEFLTGRILVILGKPGDGKSSFCTSFYMKFRDQIKINVLELSDEFFCNKLFNEKNEIDFYSLFDSYTKNCPSILDNHIIFFDGYDELFSKCSIELRDFIDKLDSYIKYEFHNTKVIITSRSSYFQREDIQYIIKADNHVGSIRPLDLDQQKTWIEKYNSLNKSKRPKKFYNVQEIEVLKNKNNTLYSLTQIPIMFQLIVEYNFDSSIANKTYLLEELLKKTTVDREGKRHTSLNEKDINALHEQLEKLAALIHTKYRGKDNQEIAKNDDIKQLEYCFYCKSIKGKIFFLHRSFYQHFLAYYIFHMFISLSSDDDVQNFFKFYSYNYLFYNKELISTLDEIILIEDPKKVRPKIELMIDGLMRYYQFEFLKIENKQKEFRNLLNFIISLLNILKDRGKIRKLGDNYLDKLFYHTTLFKGDEIFINNDFSGCISKEKFPYRILDNYYFKDTLIENVNFNSVLFRKITYQYGAFKKVEFNHCILKGCTFSKCKFENVIFNSCDLTDVLFKLFTPSDYTLTFENCILPEYWNKYMKYTNAKIINCTYVPNSLELSYFAEDL